MAENHHSDRNPPVRYTVRFPAPHTHYAEVEAVFPIPGGGELEVFLPVWTPGSYLVREFSRHLEGLAVDGGTVTMIAKNRWHLSQPGAAAITLRYRVYCREMSVRTNWVEEGFAFLNGAPTFITGVALQSSPHEIRLELPAGWKISETGLAAASSEPHHYRAANYDALVDSPILAGNPAVYRFEVDGIPHLLVNEGECGVWDGRRAAEDLEKLVRAHRDMWGPLPYQKYVFLNLITESTGGLEHANSTVLMTSRWSTSTRQAYMGWLDLASHEFFHVWNVKRLRPVELGPFDYEHENYTRSLWMAEGFTDYYSFLLVKRAGLISAMEYLSAPENSLSAKIDRLQSKSGRLVQSVEMASFEAWTKFYRPNENSENTTISYYTKGAVVAWMLDARIRRMTGGAKSLDDLMRLCCARYSGTRGFTAEELEATAEEVAGGSLGGFFRSTVHSAEELDYSEALSVFGLKFREEPVSLRAVLGAETAAESGRLIVKKVPRATPAYASGLNVDDEILAIDGFRVKADQLAKRLESCRPLDQVRLLIARRDRVMEVSLTLAAESRKWTLQAASSIEPAAPRT